MLGKMEIRKGKGEKDRREGRKDRGGRRARLG